DAPTLLAFVATKVRNRRVYPNTSLWQSLRDGVNKFLHAIRKRDKQTPTRSASTFAIARSSLLLGPHGPDDAVFIPLHFLKAWHGCSKAELVWIRRINSSDQRLRDALQRFSAETTPNERAKAFVAVLSAVWEKKFRRHAQLSAPGKKRGLNEGPETRGCQQKKAFRQRH